MRTSIGWPGIAVFAFAYRLGGREHLSEERFFFPPKPPSLSKDFYSRYRVQHWLHQCGGAMPQPAQCAIAGIKVFGKRGARGEKNLSSERFSPRTVRRGERCNSRPPHAGPHLRERENKTRRIQGIEGIGCAAGGLERSSVFPKLETSLGYVVGHVLTTGK